jgi:hypothetical protein
MFITGKKGNGASSAEIIKYSSALLAAVTMLATRSAIPCDNRNESK